MCMLACVRFPYLSCPKTHHKVGNKSILRLSATVTHHHTPAAFPSQITPGHKQIIEKCISSTEHFMCRVVSVRMIHLSGCRYLRFNGFCHRTNLVDFEKQTVACLTFNCCLHPKCKTNTHNKQTNKQTKQNSLVIYYNGRGFLG